MWKRSLLGSVVAGVLTAVTSACVVVGDVADTGADEDNGNNNNDDNNDNNNDDDDDVPGEGEGEAAEGEGEAGEGEDEEPPLVVSWAGTWTVSVAYNVTCDAAGSERTMDSSGTWAMTLTGPNSDLEGETSGFYYVDGSGRETRLLLSGAFPLKGTDNQDAITTGAAIAFAVEASDENTATGTISGSYESGFGLDCTINSGTATFAR